MAKAVTFGPKTGRKLLDIANSSPRTPVNPGAPMVPLSNGAPIVFRNESGEAVPAYACMKMIGAELDANTDRYVITITKPDGIGAPYVQREQ